MTGAEIDRTSVADVRALASKPSHGAVDSDLRRSLWTWLSTAIAALWVANVTHELGHIAPELIFRVANGEWTRTIWQRLLISTGGPAATIAIMTSACVLVSATSIRRSTRKQLIPFVTGLGMAAVSRFLILAPEALTVFTGRPLVSRPDELRIGMRIGVPANTLLFAELVVAIGCAAFLIWRIPRTGRVRASAALVVGIVIGWITWLATAELSGMRIMM